MPGRTEIRDINYMRKKALPTNIFQTCTVTEIIAIEKDQKTSVSTPISQKRAAKFPIERRSQQRKLSMESQPVIDK